MTMYNNIDYIAVQHYLMFDNKVDAYLFSRTGLTKTNNTRSLKNMAWAYFASEHIKQLIEVERQRFKDNLPNVLIRFGMKNTITTNIVENNQPKQNTPETKAKKLTKEDLITTLALKLADNPSEDTIKALAPLMTKLQQWDKEKTTENSNITLYELPKKA